MKRHFPWNLLRGDHNRVAVSRYKLAFFWLVTFAVLLELWFLYTATPKISELLVGIGAAALAATATVIVEGQRFAQFSPRPRWLALFITVPWYALTGTAAIWWTLLKRIAGRKSDAQLKAIKFDAGGDDAESAARRALALTLTTIPPNFVVIGIDQEHDTMLIHQVSPTGTPWVTKQLGALE